MSLFDEIRSIAMNPDNVGMGTGPSDIITPSVNNPFGKMGDISILDTIGGAKTEPTTETNATDTTDATDAPKTSDVPIVANTTLSIIDQIDTTDPGDEHQDTPEEGEENKGGRPKVSKDAMISYLAEKISSGEFEAYEDYDEKTPIHEYLSSLSDKDRNKLIDSNLEQRRNKDFESIRTEVLQSLPGSLQYAAEAVARGATEADLQDIYTALLRVEQTRALDVADENDQEVIAFSYLQATGFGNGNRQIIQDQVNEWKTDGKLELKAGQFKPMLDQMQEQQVQYQMQQVEEQRREQEELQRYYTQNVIDALNTGDLDGIKLDRKKQAEFYDRLTKVYPSPISGKPVNSLGAALEKIQFSDQPNYKLLVHLDWLANDPQGYWNMMKQLGKNEANVETERKLKSAQASRTQTTAYDEPEAPQIKKKGIIRQVNPFSK